MIQRKKILYIHHIGQLGGASISMLDNIKMLCKKFSISIIVPMDISEDILSILRNYNIEIHKYDGYFPRFSYYSGSNSFLSRSVISELIRNFRHGSKFYDFVKQIECDVILCNTSVLSALGKYLNKINIPKILYIRETFTENIVSRYIIRNINKYFTAVFAISGYENKYAKFQIPYIVITDVYIPTKKIINPIKVNDKFKVLFLGGTSYLKGFTVISRAVRYLDDNIQVIILGDIDYKKGLGKWYIHPFLHLKYLNATKIFNNRQIIKVGLVNDVSTYIASSDLIVFPSTKPHQPRPIIEAGFYSRTAIISDYEQTKEFFKDNFNVITFKPNNALDLSNKINNLNRNRDSLLRLGQNNYMMSNKYHNYDIEKEKINKAIETIIESKGN